MAEPGRAGRPLAGEAEAPGRLPVAVTDMAAV